MADESKTEKPTAKRRSEAHAEGNFAKAPEIGVVFILLGAFAYMSFQGPALANQMGAFARYLWGHLHQFDLNVTSVPYYLSEICKIVLGMLLPFLIICFAAAVMAGGLQSGFKLTPKVLKLNFAALSPVKGLQRMFSMAKLVEFGISMLKFVVVAWIIWGVVVDICHDPIFYTSVSVEHVAEFIHKTFLAMLAKLILAIGVLAILNYAYQKWQTTENLKMSKQEVEDEMKNSEGNPQIKGARRRMAFRIAYRNILTKVPLADVVVTNPTHFAVALKYERGKDSAPIVLAKGKDLLAQRIKQIARKHDVPMVENRPIARALYKHSKVGQAIPGNLYQAVAQILAFVYRTHRYYFHRLKARRLAATA